MGTASGCEFPSAGTNVITPPSTGSPSNVTVPFTVPLGGPVLQPATNRTTSKNHALLQAMLELAATLEIRADTLASVDRARRLPHVEGNVVGNESRAAVAQGDVDTRGVAAAGRVVLINGRLSTGH